MGGDPRSIWNWIFLSHHSKSEVERCVLLPCGRRRIAVCARCAGLYPFLFLVLAVQIYMQLDPMGRIDWWITLVGVAPMMIDWGRNRLSGPSGSNWLRLLSGALAGAALGRSFFLYFRDTLSEVFWVQICMIAFAFLAVEFTRSFHLRDLDLS